MVLRCRWKESQVVVLEHVYPSPFVIQFPNLLDFGSTSGNSIRRIFNCGSILKGLNSHFHIMGHVRTCCVFLVKFKCVADNVRFPTFIRFWNMKKTTCCSKPSPIKLCRPWCFHNFRFSIAKTAALLRILLCIQHNYFSG